MSLKWSRNPAGYLPGQSQHLTVSFVNRDKNKVTIKYSFTAVSLGGDGYSFNQRHNKLTLYFTYKNTSGESTTVKETYSYQAQGYCAHRSHSGSLTLKNVANNETSIKVAIENKRIWVNAPSNSWDPRTTGVVGKTSAGTLTVEAAKKYTVKFVKDNDVAKVSALPKKFEDKYAGSSITAPKTVTDSRNYYVCTGFTRSAKASSSEANLKKPTLSLGKKITVEDNQTYYATWKPQTYKYHFFKDSSLKTKFPADKDFAGSTNPIIHTYNKPTTLPNLEIYNKTKDDSKPGYYFTDYYKEGYTFKGWNYAKGFIEAGGSCNAHAATSFYPEWEAKKIRITFDYGFDSKVEVRDYEYGDPNFDLTTLVDVNGKYDNTLFRPGYKLVGWSFKNPDKIFTPLSVTASDIDYTYDYRGDIKYPTAYSTLGRQLYNQDVDGVGLTLYAVWEYYTVCYVFTEGQWRLAIPYVYTDNKWSITMSYVNTDNKWRL